MLHAWVTITYFWHRGDSKTENHIIEYSDDDQLTETVGDIYRQIEEEMGNGQTKKLWERVKIEGEKGFAIVDLDEAFTEEQMIRMGLLDREHEDHVAIDRKTWGRILAFGTPPLPPETSDEYEHWGPR